MGLRETLVQPAQGVISERSGERAVILHPGGDAMSTLSPVGVLVWEALPDRLGHVLDRLADAFPAISEEVLQNDLEAFVDDLVARGLAVASDADD